MRDSRLAILAVKNDISTSKNETETVKLLNREIQKRARKTKLLLIMIGTQFWRRKKILNTKNVREPVK